jgi:hypothetical protein
MHGKHDGNIAALPLDHHGFPAGGLDLQRTTMALNDTAFRLSALSVRLAVLN